LCAEEATSGQVRVAKPLGQTEGMVTELARAGAASPALQGVVDGYNGYRLTGYPPGTHQGLPSGTLTLVISLHDPVDLARMPNPHQAPSRYSALVGGLHQLPVVISHPGVQYGIHTNLHPLAARALFGLPASVLASTVVDLADLWGRSATDELLNRLADAGTWRARLAVLDRFLADRVDPSPGGPRDEVAWAWQRLTATAGAVDVRSLATEVGWSTRHLSQQVRNELGSSPKALARVLRFKRSTDLLRRPDRPGMAMVAALCGYSDQSHLNRDWRVLAGMPPGAWLRAEVLDPPRPVGALEPA
jgi:AraC-like DNA-binding protein